MTEHTVRHEFIFQNQRHVVTCFDVAAVPVTLRFRVDRVEPDGNTNEVFTFEASFEDWPYGIAFTETDNLILHQFQMIEQAVIENV